MDNVAFESLSSDLFEPLSNSILRQIRGGDLTNTPMPTKHTKDGSVINDGATTQDNTKKKKKYPVT